MPPQHQHQDPKWLAHYSTPHPWHLNPQTRTFTRALGLVETSFDLDGTRYGGRADMTTLLTLSMHTEPSKSSSSGQLHARFAMAWAALGLRHLLLRARIVGGEEGGSMRAFSVCVPVGWKEAVEEAMGAVEWGFDWEEAMRSEDVYGDALNVGRVVDPQVRLSRVVVLPGKVDGEGKAEMRLLIVMAHAISDGVAAFGWFGDLVRLLNMPQDMLEGEINEALNLEAVRARLPLAQEDFYPRMVGNRARRMWFWAILRVLRHVQKTTPPTFTNPLFRPERLRATLELEPRFPTIFDYSEATRPPMSSGHVTATLSRWATERLVSLCRENDISIGAGCFALTGIAMMEMHEARHPEVALADRQAMTASFPLNPRGFFENPPPADSCMLSFSDGIVMPFLPSSLPILGRLRLVAKHANRELRVYQKRLKDGVTATGLDKYSSGRLLATGYLAQIERVESKMPESRSEHLNPQGELPVAVGKYGATCGVSSTGPTAAFFRPGSDHTRDKDFVVEFRDVTMGVRARENEFLIGSRSNPDGCISFGVSYDMNAISEESANAWAAKICGLLEDKPQM